jgi:hypothetical protein
MISARKMAAFMLLAVFATGCRHKTPPIVPAQAAQVPPLPPKPDVQVASLPPVPQPATPKVGPPGSDQPPQQPSPQPKHPAHKRTKPVTPPTTTTPTTAEQPAKEAPTTQQASAGEAPAVSPIGQLSTAGDSGNTPSKHDIQESIDGTEKGLNDLKRALSKPEQETAAQIRTFLGKAREALTQGDLEGAHTLAIKAKVLLDELTSTN